MDLAPRALALVLAAGCAAHHSAGPTPDRPGPVRSHLGADGAHRGPGQDPICYDGAPADAADASGLPPCDGDGPAALPPPSSTPAAAPPPCEPDPCVQAAPTPAKACDDPEGCV